MNAPREADLRPLLAELADERRDLLGMVEGRDAWDIATPAEGWSVRDQVAHLAAFDVAATIAATEPGPFAAEVARATADYAAYDTAALGDRARPGSEVAATWRAASAGFDAAYAALDPAARVPWYGPAMAARSMVIARLMETWAHGQDVADALGVTRTPTDRLRHICWIAARARPYAYAVRGLPLPEGPVGVDVALPSGARWTAHPDAAQQVRGSALDLCLVLTQRRHVADTALSAEGPQAAEWLRIGQAYAGPPGPGRGPSA